MKKSKIDIGVAWAVLLSKLSSCVLCCGEQGE